MGRKCMHVRPVYLWSARVKDAVIMRISSYALLRRAPHFSDCTALVCRSLPTPWAKCAAAGLLETRNQFSGNGTTPRTLILCTYTGAMDSTTLWNLDGGPHTAVYITTASCPSTGAVACLAGHRVRLNHSATSPSGPIMRMRPLANGN